MTCCLTRACAGSRYQFSEPLSVSASARVGFVRFVLVWSGCVPVSIVVLRVMQGSLRRRQSTAMLGQCPTSCFQLQFCPLPVSAPAR
eukprot:11221111-Lingulodinium_polyedra.AAC.1